ncbi:hypothetical protein KQY30_19970 [Streptomyces sp. GMY02]|uniref:hypothetical protein n=1 Tax=Streptomyces sp. GMY02 TaxID=1333528 RepID=UPI001C2CA45B|nr:hypothetical protein [Streptomyces sp. GMY02]QXE36178.1 hypothetical protein KQY30_19970 [Streptomyces sp. GMY02]
MTTTVPPAADSRQPVPGQSLSLVLDAEITTDSDTGLPMLVASTSHNQHDIREITPAQLRAKTAELRAQLDAFDALADRYEFAALVAEHGFTVQELDTSLLGEDLRRKFLANLYDFADGRTILAVPAGQDTAERLRVTRMLVAHLERGEQSA